MVIPVAGLGTRLLPSTKEQPKEMLPVFSPSIYSGICLKPLLQVVYERLYDAGFREFCFIVGRGKRSIEDHFTLDQSFLDFLRKRNKTEMEKELGLFYEKIRRSAIHFANQPEPRGLGDAVSVATLFTNDQPFLVHAGDDLIISKNNDHLRRLRHVFAAYNADAVLCLERMKDPGNYGVVVSDEITKGVHRVRRVIEKPSHPPSNLAIVAIYIFRPAIYNAIRKTDPDGAGEVQLTDAIQRFIEDGFSVFGVELQNGEKRLDIGTPESYWKTLKALKGSMRIPRRF